MKIRFKKLHPEAVAPTRAHDTDAGWDLVATSCEVSRGGLYVYGTGLAFEIPDGYVGLGFHRSSASKSPLILANCVAVIDSGFRGEVIFRCRPAVGGGDPYREGERIFQLVILKLPDVEFEEADELSESPRGTGGFGSTGK